MVNKSVEMEGKTKQAKQKWKQKLGERELKMKKY